MGSMHGGADKISAIDCNSLQFTATHCNTLQHMGSIQAVADAQDVLSRRSASENSVAICCKVSQCVTVYYSNLFLRKRPANAGLFSQITLQYVAVCRSMLLRVAVYCNVL